MTAVEQLLRERDEEFLEALQAYQPNAPVEVGHEYLEIRRIWDIQVIGNAARTYTVKVVFNSNDPGNKMATGTISVGNSGLGEQIIIALRIDGDDFEIVGHREVSADDRPEQAAVQATDPAEPSGEFSGN